MTQRPIRQIAAAAMLVSLCCVPTLAADRDSLAPTGTLRATFLGGNPVQGRVDPSTGAVTGPVAEMVAELARRLGVPFKITPSDGVPAVMNSVKAHTADIGFLAFDATRAAEVDFSQPYSLAFNSFLVRADSPIHTVADADREGVRIAAPKGDSGDLYLSRNLKHAELKSLTGASVEDVLKMLAASEIDAFATNRQRLTEASTRAPNLRLVSDNFFGVQQSLVVAKGDAAKLDFINSFIDDVRASGLLQTMLNRSKLNGVEVAPARSK